MTLTDAERQRAAAVIADRTRHYVPEFLADEALEELEAAGWTVVAPVDIDSVREANQWAARWIGTGRRQNTARAREFVALAVAHEPDAVLRIAERLAARHRDTRIDTTGT